MHKETKKITESQVEYWLGSDAQLEEAIDVLVEIANGNYSPKLLREEILDLSD